MFRQFALSVSAVQLNRAFLPPWKAAMDEELQTLLSLAVTLGWSLFHMDVKNAFLYGDLTDYVLMEQPPGYVIGERTKYAC